MNYYDPFGMAAQSMGMNKQAGPIVDMDAMYVLGSVTRNLYGSMNKEAAGVGDYFKLFKDKLISGISANKLLNATPGRMQAAYTAGMGLGGAGVGALGGAALGGVGSILNPNQDFGESMIQGAKKGAFLGGAGGAGLGAWGTYGRQGPATWYRLGWNK